LYPGTALPPASSVSSVKSAQLSLSPRLVAQRQPGKINIEEVIKLFELEKINRRNAAFELDKCFWLNGQYIAQMSLDRFVELARPFLEKAKIDISNEQYLRNVLAIVKEKIKLLEDVPEWTAYFFTQDYAFDPAAVEKVFGQPEAATRLSALRDSLARSTIGTSSKSNRV
jgi:glutamyl/glutaminyl-tRNA synthetase